MVGEKQIGIKLSVKFFGVSKNSDGLGSIRLLRISIHTVAIAVVPQPVPREAELPILLCCVGSYFL